MLASGDRIIKGQEKVKWALGDPDEIAVVQRIFKLRLEGKGYGSIVAVLNNEGIPCPKRGRWRSKDRKWSGVTIKSILENPAYYGARAYNRNSMSDICAEQKGKVKKDVTYPHWKNDESEWILVPNAHEAIVSEEDWMKVNSMKRATKKNVNGYTYRSQYVLTGRVRCSRCGFSFQGWSGKSKGHNYYRYVDGGWVNKRVCSHYAIDRDELEGYAVSCIRATIAHEALNAELKSQLQNIFGSQATDGEMRRKRIEKELLDCASGIENLVSTLAGGLKSPAILDKLKNLESKKSNLARELQGCEAEAMRSVEVTDLAAKIRRFSENFEEIFERADIEEKKELMRIWIREILVDRDNGVLQVFVREIPALVPELLEKGANKKGTHLVVSAQSSGDPVRTPDGVSRRTGPPLNRTTPENRPRVAGLTQRALKT